MITLGIDLSSQKGNTAACLIEWRDDGILRIAEPVLSCDDDALDALIKEATVIGIDAPFGWPEAFRSAVNEWSSEEWTPELRDELRFRKADRNVIACLKTRFPELANPPRPLSASSDKIALPAMRAMALLKRHGVTDKSGDGRFYEVYPAASLAMWELPHRGYKNGADAVGARMEILSGIRQKSGLECMTDTWAASDHALDALISALTARAAHRETTIVPSTLQLEIARSEGWIHLPERWTLSTLSIPIAKPNSSNESRA